MSMKDLILSMMLEHLEEKTTNPYAIGMAAAMKATGDEPPLKKSTITKAHKIAKSIEKNESSILPRYWDDFGGTRGPVPNKKAYAVDKANDVKKPVSLKKAPWEKNEEVELDEELEFQKRVGKNSNSTEIFHKGKHVGTISKHYPRNGRPEGYHVINYHANTTPKGANGIHTHEKIDSHDAAKKMVAKHFNESVELDEISQEKLGSYYDAATKDRKKARAEVEKGMAQKKFTPASVQKTADAYKRFIKRGKGMTAAANKMDENKED